MFAAKPNAEEVEEQKFRVILDYTVSLVPAWAMWDPIVTKSTDLSGAAATDEPAQVFNVEST